MGLQLVRGLSLFYQPQVYSQGCGTDGIQRSYQSFFVGDYDFECIRGWWELIRGDSALYLQAGKPPK